LSIPTTAAAQVPNASYLRTLRVEDAVAARKAIAVFFGTVQPTIAPAPRLEKNRLEKSAVDPAVARWVLYGGIVLLIASLLTSIFRDWLPPGTPGFYLGVGGLMLSAAGGTYWWYMWLTGKRVQVAPDTKDQPTDKGREAVESQVKHIEANAEALFGAVPNGGRRFVLQGIGRKEWNNGHEFPVREFANDRIFASVVHLLVVDLTQQFVAVRELGLDLSTGTICEESAIRRPVSELLNATRRAQNIPATAEWDRAEKLAEKLAAEAAALEKATPRTADKTRQRATAIQAEMKGLSFDDVAGDEFALCFTGTDKVVLNVADKNLARNLRKVAFPIGGQENLDTVITAWDAINAARANAEAARYEHRAVMQSSTVGTEKSVTTAQQGLAGFQDALLQGVNVMVQKLSGLETAIQALAAHGGSNADTAVDRGIGVAATMTLPALTAARAAATSAEAVTQVLGSASAKSAPAVAVNSAVNGAGKVT
jgi:hypothetical protein